MVTGLPESPSAPRLECFCKRSCLKDSDSSRERPKGQKSKNVRAWQGPRAPASPGCRGGRDTLGLSTCRLLPRGIAGTVLLGLPLFQWKPRGSKLATVFNGVGEAALRQPRNLGVDFFCRSKWGHSHVWALAGRRGCGGECPWHP